MKKAVLIRGIESETLLAFIVLLGVFGGYLYLINGITVNYLPVWSDEVMYFVNTISFVENNTLQAALTYGGKGSEIFGADAHGFAYPLLHGTIAKIFGWSNLNFIVFNFIATALAISAIWLVKEIRIKHKLWASAFVLLFPFIPLYGFTYMQEVIHVFFAILLSVIVYLMYSRSDNRKFVWLFIIIIVIAGCFRALWFFWLIGLIPLARNRKQLGLYMLVIVAGITASMLITRFFTEPIPNFFSSIIIMVQEGEISNAAGLLLNKFNRNVTMYFQSFQGGFVYVSMKFALIAPVLLFAILGLIKKSRLYSSIALIGFANFLLLFFLYNAFDWREIRTMSPLFYFYVLFLVTAVKPVFRYFMAGGLVVVFAFTISTSQQWINDRNVKHTSYSRDAGIAYEQIAQKVPDNSLIFLNVHPGEYTPSLLYLPLKNANNQQIKYIIPYFGVKTADYDYMLCLEGGESGNNVVTENNFYTLINME